MTRQLACNFDEASGDIVDYSGQSHDFALNNSLVRTAAGGGVDATTGADSATGKGLTRLGGAGSMGLVTSSPFITSAAWTISFWQKNPGNGIWWFRLYNVGLDSGSGILNVGGTLRARIKTAAGANVEVSTAPPAADNSWHYYAATYDGNVGRFYIDAALIGTTASVPSPAAIDRIDIAEHTLDNFSMDDVRIDDVALSLAEIAELMDAPVEAETTVTGLLELALGPSSFALLGQASSVAQAELSLAAPVTALAGTASATASLGMSLAAPVPMLTGQSRAEGTLSLALAAPVVSLVQEQPSEGIPLIGGLSEVSPILVGPAVATTRVLAGPAQAS